MDVKTFLEYLAHEKNYSPNTILAYNTDIREFQVFCKKEYEIGSIINVDYSLIRSWIVNLVDHRIGNRSINRKVASLKAYFKFLQKIEKIKVSPLSKHKALKTAKKIEVPFSENEMDQVLLTAVFEDDFEGLRNKAIIELLYASGIRRSELIYLKTQNVNLQERTIKVLGKRNKERIIPLLETTSEALSEYLTAREVISGCAEHDYFFILKSGNKLYETLVYRIINGYFSKVSSKVKKSPHILRHTFATHMLNKGADLNSVKELLGHASLASTQVYTHNSIAELKKVHSASHPRSRD